MATQVDGARVRSLDGLRGVAAIVVLLHHATLLSPAFAAFYYTPQDAGPALGTFAWWVSHTPLQLLVSGQEAVLVFFVLSGLAVAYPVVRQASSFDWYAYYPRRIVRLLVPVIGSVLLAAIVILATRQNVGMATSLWSADALSDGLTPQAVVLGAELLGGDSSINNPLWSLRWELLFSLLLPVYVLTARAGVRTWRMSVLAVVAVIVVMALGQYSGDLALIFLPPFLLGTMLAVQPRVWSSEREPGWSWRGPIALVLALVLIESRWIMDAVGWDSQLVLDTARVLATLGAGVLVLLAARWRPMQLLLELRPIQWLGRISFSLYLVHVPIIIGTLAVVWWINPALPWYVSSMAAIPIALGVGIGFQRLIEAPSHRLARHIGRLTTQQPDGGGAASRITATPEVTDPRAAATPSRRSRAS